MGRIYGTHDNSTGTSWWENLARIKTKIKNNYNFLRTLLNLIEIGMTTKPIYLFHYANILSLNDHVD